MGEQSRRPILFYRRAESECGRSDQVKYLHTLAPSALDPKIFDYHGDHDTLRWGGRVDSNLDPALSLQPQQQRCISSVAVPETIHRARREDLQQEENIDSVSIKEGEFHFAQGPGRAAVSCFHEY